MIVLKKDFRLTRLLSSVQNLEFYDTVPLRIREVALFVDIESESSSINTNYRAPRSFQQNGDIEIKNLRMKYRENAPMILKRITVTFASA